MPTLTVDLSDPRDVTDSISILKRVASRHQAAPASREEPDPLGDATEEEVRGELADLLSPEIRNLLDTRTGRLLILPFVEKFPEGATIEEISQILDCEPGVDRVRKAHSLIAGLGRWETPRQIKIFESLGGRPQRYRMNPDILEIVARERRRRAQRTE